MKTKILYLFSLLCLVLASCNDDDDPVVVLSQTQFEVPCEGGTYRVDVSSLAKWSAKSVHADWLVVSNSGKAGDTQLVVEVEGNLQAESRTGQVEIAANGEVHQVSFTQQGKPAGDELKYRVPLIFHVLYHDPANPGQNIPTERIYEVLNQVNQMYEVNGIKLEFVLATTDPQGNLLKEAGIERVHWPASSIDPRLVMEGTDREFMHLLWEPADYVNVLLYNFSIQNILGISTFPLTPKSHPLEGTESVDNLNLNLSNLTKMRCVSLNSSWMMAVGSDPLAKYIPADLLRRQTDSAITLAHELGHYFGLRHVFSESMQGACVDTDFCKDTPSYNKSTDYDQYLQMIWSEQQFNPNFDNEFKWEDVFKRSSCKDGSDFVSHNIMDYSYSYLDEFTADQRARMRHVLDYSPLIPGPKQTRAHLTRSVEGPVDLPHEIVVCELPVVPMK